MAKDVIGGLALLEFLEQHYVLCFTKNFKVTLLETSELGNICSKFVKKCFSVPKPKNS